MTRTIAHHRRIRRLGTTAALRFGMGAVLAVLFVGAGAATATAQPMADERQALEAMREALIGATIETVEIDTSQGAPEIEIDVRTREGVVYEVTFDTSTATVLSVEKDED